MIDSYTNASGDFRFNEPFERPEASPADPPVFFAPWTASQQIDLPETRTLRELDLIVSQRPDLNMGFFAKAGTAFSNETVIGEIIREFKGPDFVDVGYVATDEDKEKYASDLDPTTVDRVANASDSFPEFLYELDQARLTIKRRQELFAGGTLGAIEGLGLTLLAAGGEAVALTLLAGAIGTAIGGPAGTTAAAGATAVTRIHRIKGMLKAMGMAAAIDIPLESTRYALDKTLKPRDLVIALGASAGLSGAIGAWKPQIFLRSIQNMSHTAAVREAGEAAAEAGDTAVAEAVEAQTRQTVRVVPFDDDFDEVMSIPTRKKDAEAAGVEGLFDAAKREGVETTRVTESGRRVPRTVDDVRADLIEARRANRPSVDAVERQTLRDLDEMDAPARRREGRRLGIPQKTIDRGGKTLVNAIVKARKFAADRGFVMVDQMPKLPKGVRLRTSTSIKGVKVTFRGPLEKALWSLHTGKGLEQKKVLSDWFKKSGIENPEELAKEFADEMRKRAKAAKEGELIADTTSMKLKSGVRVREDGSLFVPGEGENIFMVKRGIDQKVDADIVPDIPKAKNDPGVHPMEEPEVVAMGPDGKPIAIGSSSDMAQLDEMALGGDPGKYTVSGHGMGVREAIGRAIEVMGDIPGFRLIYKAFAPVTLRLLRSDSDLVRRFADTFLENPRGGGNNVTTVVRLNVERHLGKLGQALEEAKAAARAEGRKLDELEVVRALRRGDEVTGPEAIAVNGLRRFHADLRKYGLESGVFNKSFPESATYFHRAWKPQQFNALIDEFGEEQVTEFIAKAVMNHKNTRAAGIDITKARKIAKRIVEYGSEPQSARDWKKTGDMLKRMKEEITKEFLEDARIAGREMTDEVRGDIGREVDDFIDAVIPSIDNQPHLSYGKRRIDLDETFSMTMGGRTVHIDELMNNNILPNVTRYAHKVIGGSEVRKGMKAVFGNADMTLGDAQKAIRKSVRESGEQVSPESPTFAEDMFDHAYKTLSGQPIYNSPKLMKWAMGSNAFAQATIGMTLGFAQIPEIASIIARTGFNAAFQQLPSLKEVGNVFTMGIRDLATGRQGLGLAQFRDDFTSCLETFTGVGGDYRRGDHFMRRLDDMGIDEDYLSSGALKYLEHGRQVAALNPLGIMPMDTFLRRWAVRSSFQHFVNEAYKIGPDGKAVLNRGWWKNSKARFEQLGMTGEDLERLSVALRDPSLVTTEPGMFGRYTVKNLDLSKAKDQAIMDKFALALRRHSDHMVQRQSFGESPYWVNTGVGKMIAQYRVFALASKSKQLAAGIARGDAHEAVNFVGACGLGVVAYQAQSYYRAIGMEERERSLYLTKKFSQENLIKAGILRGSYSSIFPALIDSGAWMLTGKGVFDDSMRTTGLGIDPIMGSVPGNLIYKKAWPAFRELSGFAFRDDSLSQQDLRHMQSLIWATKMPGLDQTINRLFINKFPKQD